MSFFVVEKPDRSSSAKAPVKAKKKAAREWTAKPLSNAQKMRISIAARDAFKVLQHLGLDDNMKFDDWRHFVTKKCCGIASLKEATNNQFRIIYGTFLQLGGKEKEAQVFLGKTGMVKGSDELKDTHERREQARFLISNLIGKSDGLITHEYMVSIAADKFNNKPLADLTASQLQDLFITLNARLQAKLK